jgi:hypothetical protein
MHLIFAPLALAAALLYTPPSIPASDWALVKAGRWMTTSMYWQDKLVAYPANAPFHPIGFTAASKEFPFGTVLRVSNPHNGRSVIVWINDRGPFIEGRELDLSLGAASAIGFSGVGPTYVEVVSLTRKKAPPLPIVAQMK